MSLSHRYSRHSVRDPSPNRPTDALFSYGIFTMKQHQWTPKPSTEMAPRPHHLRIRVVDRVLDLFRRLHLYIPRLVEQRCHEVLRQ